MYQILLSVPYIDYNTVQFLFFYRKNAKKCIAFVEAQVNKQKTVAAAERFMNILRAVDNNKDSIISFHEFQEAFAKVYLWYS